MSLTTMGPKGPLHPNTAIAGGVIIYGTVIKRGADETHAAAVRLREELLGSDQLGGHSMAPRGGRAGRRDLRGGHEARGDVRRGTRNLRKAHAKRIRGKRSRS